MSFYLGLDRKHTVEYFSEPSPYLKKTWTVRHVAGVCEITESTWCRGYDKPFATITTFHGLGVTK